MEVLADDEWFVVGVALVGGVSGKRIINEGLKNKEGFAPSREEGRRAPGRKTPRQKKLVVIWWS